MSGVLQQEVGRHADSHEGQAGRQDWQRQQQCLHAAQTLQDVRHSWQWICEAPILPDPLLLSPCATPCENRLLQSAACGTSVSEIRLHRFTHAGQ